MHDEYELNKETKHLDVLRLFCSVKVRRVIIITPPSRQCEGGQTGHSPDPKI